MPYVQHRGPRDTTPLQHQVCFVFWSTSSSLFVLCRDSWKPHRQINSYKRRKTRYTLKAIEGVKSRRHRLRPFVRLLGTFLNPNPGTIFFKRKSRNREARVCWVDVKSMFFSPLQARSAAPRYCLQNGPLPWRMWAFRCSSHTLHISSWKTCHLIISFVRCSWTRTNEELL